MASDASDTISGEQDIIISAIVTLIGAVDSLTL
jgi:hypothetical protein